MVYDTIKLLMKNPQQIIIIHGGTTYESHEEYFLALKNLNIKLDRMKSSKDWKDSLQEKLGEDFIVYIPQMPNKQNAQYEEWKILFEKVLELLDEDIVLIGHSMGGIFLAKYLSENNIHKKIQKTFLISAPFSDEGLIHESLCSFVREGDLNNFEKQAGKVYLYHSQDDMVVPYDHVQKYAKELPSAVVREFKDRGHFKQESIVELVEDVLEDLS